MSQKDITSHPAWEAGRTKKMSEFTDLELKNIEDNIRQALFKMLVNNEFFGIVALKLRREFTDSIPTGATDGRVIYFNPAFVEKLSTDELIFLICHEVWHCVFEHFLRRGERVPQWWNMAGDYVINLLCKRDGIGKVIDGALIDDKYKEWTTEQIYDEIESKNMEFLETLDFHMDVGSEDDGDEEQDSDGENSNGKGFKKKISEEDAKAIREEIKGSIIQAAKAAGNTPAEIKRIIKEFLEPQVRWQDLLETTIMSTERYDTSFMRPHKRSWSNPYGIIFPGDLPGHQINLAIAIDTSGSISDEMLKEFLSEVNGIMQNYTTFKITLWCFDTRVSGVTEITHENRDDLMSYESTGGGGTYIKSNFDFFEDNEIEADMMIVFTDLYCGSLGMINPNIVDTVWVINNDQKPPFGKYARFVHGAKY